MDSQRQSRDLIVMILILSIMSVFTVGLLVLLSYLDKQVVSPFKKLKVFASNVAAGNLDTPLMLEKSNAFGAYTQSFDLMRTELACAKEAERKANQSKKELIASLSHDIKTPLASIKAISELMQVSVKDEKQQDQLTKIISKADQISLLTENMFQATMEELEKLKVLPEEISSKKLIELINEADYQNKVTIEKIPDCLIYADQNRLAQVVDNVISNSYKYAQTKITINAQIKKNNLYLKITDYGKGVLEEEKVLLTQKFFRGENVGEKEGTGLGLYISKYFMREMYGELKVENTSDTFSIVLILKLVQ